MSRPPADIGNNSNAHRYNTLQLLRDRGRAVLQGATR